MVIHTCALDEEIKEPYLKDFTNETDSKHSSALKLGSNSFDSVINTLSPQ